MDSAEQLHFANASDRSYFAIIKKDIHALAQRAGLNAKRVAESDIVIAEIVSNLSKHATNGELFVKYAEGNTPGIEIIVIDQGPGMSDVTRMMTDGMSTTNTLGHGLGAIQRLTDKFQVYSQKEWGTILYCTLYNEPVSSKRKNIDVQALLATKPNESVCGDGFYYKTTKDHVKLFLADGLGHGPEAHKSATTAIEAFKMCPFDSPLDILRFMHTAVKKTRGLVGTAAVLDMKERMWRICGIGNIQTKMINGVSSRSYLAYNGIIGLNIPNSMNDQLIPYEKGQTLAMCSDGIKSSWDVFKFPGISRYELAVWNAALYKDFARHTDDMSVVTCKINI